MNTWLKANIIDGLSQGAQEMFQELPHIYVEPHELKKAIQSTGMTFVYMSFDLRCILVTVRLCLLQHYCVLGR